MIHVDRRKFTFGSLFAAFAVPAAASDTVGRIAELDEAPQPTPQAQAQAPSPYADPAPAAAAALTPRWTVEREKGGIKATLALRNDSDEAIDLLVAVGRRPGPAVSAFVDGASLEAIATVDRRDMMSRVGPMPRFALVAARAWQDVGTYRFAAAADAREVELRAWVTVEDAPAPVELVSFVTVGAKAGA